MGLLSFEITMVNYTKKQKKIKEQENTWCLIPHEIWKDKSLSINEKCLMGRIIALAVSTGSCFSGNKYLAEEMNKSVSVVQKALRKLQKLGYIEKTYTDKRYITPMLKLTHHHVKNDTPDHVKNDTYRIDILDKNIEYNTLTYLEEIPEKDIKEFTSKFNITERQLKDKAETLADYCRYKGRTYKNYKAFLSNAIRKEFSKRQPKVKQPWDNMEVNTDNLVKIAEMRKVVNK